MSSFDNNFDMDTKIIYKNYLILGKFLKADVMLSKFISPEKKLDGELCFHEIWNSLHIHINVLINESKQIQLYSFFVNYQKEITIRFGIFV